MIITNAKDFLRKMIINRALNISDDRIEEVTIILELLNNPKLTKKDIRLMRFYVYGYLKGKLED